MVYVQNSKQVYDEHVMARLAKGKFDGEIGLVIKLLTRKVGNVSPGLMSRIGLLYSDQVEDLALALLDFSSMDDLVDRLGEYACQNWLMAECAKEEFDGKVALVVRQLTWKFDGLSPDLVERVSLLSLEQVEDLGLALLDFGSVDDLVFWLG
jgi:Domain of unknown function (DUF4351)